jgi:hypothetical protein
MPRHIHHGRPWRPLQGGPLQSIVGGQGAFLSHSCPCGLEYSECYCPFSISTIPNYTPTTIM